MKKIAQAFKWLDRVPNVLKSAGLSPHQPIPKVSSSTIDDATSVACFIENLVDGAIVICKSKLSNVSVLAVMLYFCKTIKYIVQVAPHEN